ncbi:isocitrate lyase/phosphoenolpyruvate mutase family protein [Pseudomonas moraviensis subsp. stanleyae]|uniref:isocitrate lyase/PEP mutase family protein n=1 Tax=Pseudomonas moraviensis TaxID=321662 RepID=UPI002E3381D4|nr:isocitrate lyase/phosphoenolpyruvate mutase family protein [Pseudomonas moraviensis]MED7670513.1 isocitrate lyase/phosphoenolpyruvate mutase family protein [Pseudomonas moraviensis subsp. stanleyae]
MNVQASPAQLRKAQAFKALHDQQGIFVIPNPWDAGSAKMLVSLGYQALATTSAGYAFSQGKADGALSLDETLANVRAIVAATDLPVAVDLENGFADDPGESAQSLLRAAEAGAVGGSIEDATGRPGAPIYCFEHAVARIEAAVAAVRTLPFPFVLTARAENYLHGNPDLDDTIRRLQAFAEAGADVLYAPGLRSAEEVRAVVQAVAPKPVNVLMSGGLKLTVQQLEEMGVRRISTGSALALAAFGEFFRAAEEIQQSGTFGFTSQSMPYAKANQFFKD